MRSKKQIFQRVSFRDTMDTLNHLDVERRGVIFIITLQRPPENRLTMKLCQDLISTYRRIEQELSAETLEPEGAVILRGSNAKFFTTVGRLQF